MSTTLITDTMDSTEVTRDEHGWYATRSAKVLGVTGGPSAIVYNAIQDALLTANNYNFGQVHPTMTALYCAKVAGRAIDVDKVAITCEYRPFIMRFFASATQTALLSIGASVQGTQTNLDINNAIMKVSPPTGYSDPSTGTNPEGGLAQVDVATMVLTFTRKEPSAPTANVLTYRNTVNQYNCVISGTNFPANTLKLDRINATPIDNGSGANSYMCTYEFSYNPNTWVTTIVYQNSAGVVVLDTATNTTAGTATYWNYTASDFSFLYLW